MNAAARLTAFGAGLVVLFAGGAAAGKALNPSAPGDSEPSHNMQSQGAATHGGAPEASHAQPAAGHQMPAASGVRGLAVAQDGVRLIVETPELAAGKAKRLSLRVVGDAGQPVSGFEVTHEKQMHLIVVRRDLTGFQHLHPTLGADGRWSIPLQLDAAGSYRVFTDFQLAGKPVTLAGDLRVDGQANLKPLPPPAAVARAGGAVTVTQPARRAARAGAETTLAFTVTAAGGRPAALDRYLGAGGHLVALREGDLAFLHVHPTTDTDADRNAGRVAFETTFPTAGRYRLFLQVKVAGEIHTAAFTQEVK